MRASRWTGAVLLLSAGSFAQARDVVVTGPGDRTITLDARTLRAMPRATATLNDHGASVPHEGVALTELLTRAGAPTGPALRGRAASMVVVVTGTDGYRAVLSLPETDPTVGAHAVILADRANGAPLGPSAGPYRLVVSGDRRPMRSVRMVSRIELKELP